MATYHDAAKQANALVSRDGFAGTLLISPVQIKHGNATGPGTSQVPILLTKYRKVLVLGGGIGNVANIEENVLEIGTSPIIVQFGSNGGCVDVISVVEVVVVVVPISKVQSRIHKRGAV